MLLSFICVHNTELVSWQFESLFLNYKLMDVCKLDVSSHLPPCFFQTARLPHFSAAPVSSGHPLGPQGL